MDFGLILFETLSVTFVKLKNHTIELVHDFVDLAIFRCSKIRTSYCNMCEEIAVYRAALVDCVYHFLRENELSRLEDINRKVVELQ